MIQLSRLEGFYWVGRVGGYSAAARAMPYPISQPAVYQQVRKLEIELECRLFERVGRGDMRLTPAGEKLYEFVRPFFEGLPATVRAIHANEFGGTVRIYAASQFVVELMPQWLRLVRDARPDIRVELFETERPSTELLATSEADLVIDHFPETIGREFESQHIATAYGRIVVPDAIAQRMGEQVDLDVLSATPFIGYHPNLIHHQLQADAARQLGITLHPVALVQRAEAILSLVRSGLGFSLIPSLEETGPLQEGLTSYQLSDLKFDFPIHAVWAVREPQHPLVSEVLRFAPSTQGETT